VFGIGAGVACCDFHVVVEGEPGDKSILAELLDGVWQDVAE